MSENSNFGFARLVPGFDFLQNLAKGASQSLPQMPGLSNWIAPTLNVEELEKRIAELKAVQFWLEQNGRALAATIQALEVQKMTLATLHGMNFSMGELANALKVKTGETMAAGARKMGEAAEAVASAASEVAGSTAKAEGNGEKAGEKAGDKAQDQASRKAQDKPAGNGAAPVDPLQWWGALTQQFQQIAANAMKEAVQKTTADTARNMAVGTAREAVKAATGMARAAAGAAKASKAAPAKATAPAKKAPAKKAAPRKTRAKTPSA